MADFNRPEKTQQYEQLLADIRDLFEAVGTLADNRNDSPDNMPVLLKRWDNSNSRFQEWNGSSWVTKLLAVAGGGTGASTASGARSNLNVPSQNDLDNHVNDNSLHIEPGTKMVFKQNSAPTGWTFVSEDNDRVLINTSTAGQGGDVGGSWTIGLSVNNHTLSTSQIPSHNHSGPNHRHTGPSHTHSSGSLSAANRTISGSIDIRRVGGGYTTFNNAQGAFDYSGQGGDGSRAPFRVDGSGSQDRLIFNDTHDHSVSGNTGSGGTGNTGYAGTGNTGSTGGGGSHNHGLSGDNGSWRPSYAKVITCQKN
jgi:hypothetical protein